MVTVKEIHGNLRKGGGERRKGTRSGIPVQVVCVVMTQSQEKHTPSDYVVCGLRGATLLSPLFLPPSLNHWQPDYYRWLVSII